MARSELRAAGFSEGNVRVMMMPPPTGFVMPRLFPKRRVGGRDGGDVTGMMGHPLSRCAQDVHPLFRHAQEVDGSVTDDTRGLTPEKVDSRSSGDSSDSGLHKDIGEVKTKTGKGFKNWIKEFLLAGNVDEAVSIGFPKMDA